MNQATSSAVLVLGSAADADGYHQPFLNPANFDVQVQS
jgi:hypothetical protein